MAARTVGTDRTGRERSGGSIITARTGDPRRISFATRPATSLTSEGGTAITTRSASHSNGRAKFETPASEARRSAEPGRPPTPIRSILRICSAASAWRVAALPPPMMPIVVTIASCHGRGEVVAAGGPEQGEWPLGSSAVLVGPEHLLELFTCSPRSRRGLVQCGDLDADSPARSHSNRNGPGLYLVHQPRRSGWTDLNEQEKDDDNDLIESLCSPGNEDVGGAQLCSSP